MTERVDSQPAANGTAPTEAVAAASERPGRASRLLSDDRLAKRAAKGDRSAFEEIYRRYQQSLFRFCMAMVGNSQDAQDALQNTMIKALRALPGEKRHIKLKPWLYRIARNEAIETVRRRRDSANLDFEQTSSSWEIAETVEARDRLRRLIADLDELPERQRAALVMRELAGFDFAQIGAAFETSAAVARQTVYEARLALRRMEEGREMSCESVMRELSEADGRVVRRRAVRAHLRSCQSCRAYRDSIHTRRADLAAIAPLPLAASAAMLHAIFGGSASAATGAAAAGGAGGGLAGTTVATGAGKAVATSAIVKSAATVAVVAAVGVTAADRSGVIDVPLPGGDEAAPVQGQSHSNQAANGKRAAVPSPAEGEGARPVSATDDTKHGNAAGAQSGSHRAGLHSENARARHPGHGRAKSHGRAHGHAKKHGRPAPLPEASNQGQETATGRKPPSANPSPGTTPSRGQSQPESAPSPSKPSPRQQEQGSGAPPSLPEPQSTGPPAGAGAGKEKSGSGLEP